MAVAATAIGAYLLYVRSRRNRCASSAAATAGASAPSTSGSSSVKTEASMSAATTCTATGAEAKISRAHKKASSSPCVQVVPPTLSAAWNLEYSVHRPSRLLRSDITLVFRPDLETAYASDPRGKAAGVEFDAFVTANLLAVPTWQPSTNDLSAISFPVNEERRQLLANFDGWAALVRPRLGARWSDCSCPMEGTARYGTPTSAIYNELEGLTTLLRYDSIPIGCCGIVLHPTWQRRAYPVTLFTTAPLEELQAAFAAAERRGA